MNSLIIQVVILLFIGLGLPEISTIVYWFNPHTTNIEFDLFLDRSYRQKLNVLWYIYELSTTLKWIIFSYVFCRVSQLVSHKLFVVAMIFFWYHVTQFLFYVWNRNTSFMANYVLYISMALIIVELLLPNKKISKYKSFE